MEKAKRLRTQPAHTDPRPASPLCWLLLLLSLPVLVACGRAGPEQRLREQLDTMRTALTERRPAEFVAGVSEDFSGNGGMDRAAVHNLLRIQLLANQRISATLSPAEVEMHGQQATVRFTVVLTGSGGRMLPDRAQAYRVTSGWREVDGQWQIYHAQWEAQL